MSANPLKNSRPQAGETKGAKPLRGGSERGVVQALSRGLDLLEALSGNDEGYRLKELSRLTRLPSSTMHRLLTTMEQRQFVRFDRDRYSWLIGSKALAVGAAFMRRRQLVSSALPHMKYLAETTHATVSLGILGDGNLIVLQQAFTARSGVSPITPGSRLMLHVSAMGKVLLTSRAGASGLPASALRRLTKRTITDPDRLAREIDTVAARGFAMDDEESETGKRCVAVPIYDELGSIVAAISVTAVAARLSDRRIDDVTSHIMAASKEITVAYGGHLPRQREKRREHRTA